VEAEFDPTIIVIVSLAPAAGVAVAAVREVAEDCSVEPVPVAEEGHAVSRLYRSTEPSPEAASYPVPAA
jgi:hypothetical protein